MSISASIDIKFVQCENNSISSIAILQKLLQFGWTFSDYGMVSYLPVGDNDDYDWQRENISTDSIMKILSIKEQKKENIGVVLTWKDTDIGGQFLLWNDGNLSINLTMNLKRLDGIDEINNINITDVSWYFARIIPAFIDKELSVESFSYHENS